MEITSMSQAIQLHAQAIKTGSQIHHKNYTNLFTFTALSPAGNINYARRILLSLQIPNSYYWNNMLRAYSDSSNPFETISLFLKMHLHEEDIAPKPDKYTYPFVVKACGKLKDIQMGKQVHCLICKVGLGNDRYICNCLIDMYMKFSDVDSAWIVFDEMLERERDTVSWTSMVDGLCDNGRPVEAIKVFDEMVVGKVEFNHVTVVSVLRACAETGALEVGRRVDRMAEEKGFCSNSNVITGLIDMYAKCGCIDSARGVFENGSCKDLFAWTAMIHGLSSHGMSRDAINLFNDFVKSGRKPDDRTMTAVLAACRNAGLVDEAYCYFREMRKRFGILPKIQHYGCMVDLYARSGKLSEAERLIRKMPFESDSVIWRNLIWACRYHGDTDRAERLIKEINIDLDDCSNCVLLSNLYASAGKWLDKALVRETMSKQGIVKPPGYSRIEVDGCVHEFTAGDSSHVEAQSIFEKLVEMKERLIEQGYKPELSEVLLEIDDEEKAFQLLHHSEKLALAYGLMRTPPGSQLRIVKNLRSCEDCHAFMKLVSRVYKREIIVRDRIRFHQFRDEVCSCGDHW